MSPRGVAKKFFENLDFYRGLDLTCHPICDNTNIEAEAVSHTAK